MSSVADSTCGCVWDRISKMTVDWVSVCLLELNVVFLAKTKISIGTNWIINNCLLCIAINDMLISCYSFCFMLTATTNLFHDFSSYLHRCWLWVRINVTVHVHWASFSLLHFVHRLHWMSWCDCIMLSSSGLECFVTSHLSRIFRCRGPKWSKSNEFQSAISCIENQIIHGSWQP